MITQHAVWGFLNLGWAAPTALFALAIAGVDVPFVDDGPSGSGVSAGELGVTTLLGWYLYYTVKFANPAIHKHYEGVIDKIEARHEAAVKAVGDKLAEAIADASRMGNDT